MKRKLKWYATVKRNDRTDDEQKNRSQSDKEAEDDMGKYMMFKTGVKAISLLIDTHIMKTRIF